MVSLVEAAALSLANITGLCYKQVTSARVCMCVCVHVCVCACACVHVHACSAWCVCPSCNDCHVGMTSVSKGLWYVIVIDYVIVVYSGCHLHNTVGGVSLKVDKAR